jgi:hypothetical protein
MNTKSKAHKESASKQPDMLSGEYGQMLENFDPDPMESALASTAEGITISDARLPDNPMVYVNEGFERLTGYRREDILGRNCRFLQGVESVTRLLWTNCVEARPLHLRHEGGVELLLTVFHVSPSPEAVIRLPVCLQGFSQVGLDFVVVDVVPGLTQLFGEVPHGGPNQDQLLLVIGELISSGEGFGHEHDRLGSVGIGKRACRRTQLVTEYPSRARSLRFLRHGVEERRSPNPAAPAG